MAITDIIYNLGEITMPRPSKLLSNFVKNNYHIPIHFITNFSLLKLDQITLTYNEMNKLKI